MDPFLVCENMHTMAYITYIYINISLIPKTNVAVVQWLNLAQLKSWIHLGSDHLLKNHL